MLSSYGELQASRRAFRAPEVGSSEAARRQPTCHYVQVLKGLTRYWRGFFYLCDCFCEYTMKIGAFGTFCLERSAVFAYNIIYCKFYTDEKE